MKNGEDDGDDDDDDEISDLDEPISSIPIDEITIIDNFLNSFIISGGSKPDLVDLKHAIKAFPAHNKQIIICS